MTAPSAIDPFAKLDFQDVWKQRAPEVFPLSLSLSLSLVYVNKVNVWMRLSARTNYPLSVGVLSFTHLKTPTFTKGNPVPLWATARFILPQQTFSQPTSTPTGTLPEVLLLTCCTTFLRPVHRWRAPAKVWHLGLIQVSDAVCKAKQFVFLSRHRKLFCPNDDRQVRNWMTFEI